MMLRHKVGLFSILVTVIIGFGLGAGAIIFRAEESSGPVPVKTYYVAPNGSDTTGDGTIGNPYATVDKARLAVRTRSKIGEGTGPIVVYLRQGTYEQATRINFDSADSGTVANPVIYRSYPGEHAIISGAKTVTGATAVTDPAILSRLPEAARSAVVSIDLVANGLTAGEPFKGTSTTANSTWPIFIAQGGSALQLTRYPEVADPWEKIANVIDVNGTFQYTSSEPSNWASYNDIQVHSFPQWDWADFWDTIETFTPETKTIKMLGASHVYSQYYKADAQGTHGIFYFSNVLERLNAPGKFYIDRANNSVYVWPSNSDLNTSPLMATVSDGLIKTNATTYVKFVDLEFAYSRGGITININNSSHLDFHNITVHDSNGAYILRTILDSHDITLSSSHIYNTSGSTVSLDCGDKSLAGSLRAGNCTVANTLIEKPGQYFVSGSQGVLLNGVGNRLVFSTINDASSMAVGIGGNNHIVEYNSINNAANQVNDGGAIYQGRQIVERGTTIRNNRIDNIKGRNNLGARGIYLDDGQPGYTIIGNLLNNVGEPFMITGPDTTLSNNLIVSPYPNYNPMTLDGGNYGWRAYCYPSSIASVSQTYPYVVTTTRPHGMDSWAYDKTKQIKLEGITAMPSLNGTWTVSNVTATTFQIDAPETTWAEVSDGLLVTSWTKYYDDFKATQNNSAFTSAYPELYSRELKDMYKMVNLNVNKNVFYLPNNSRTIESGISANVRAGVTLTGNSTISESDFTNLAASDFTIKQTSPVIAAGFENLPLSVMGTRPLTQFFTGLNDQTVEANKTATLTIGTDFMAKYGFTPDIYVRNMPTGATYDTVTKTISWIPQASDIGTKTITIESLGTVYALANVNINVVAEGSLATTTTGTSSGQNSTSGTTGSGSKSTTRRSSSGGTTSGTTNGSTSSTSTPLVATAPTINEFRLDTPAVQGKSTVLGVKYVLGSVSIVTVLIGLFLLWRYYRMQKNMLDVSDAPTA